MNVPVIDPFDVAGDPSMPSLALALDPHQVQKWFKRQLATWCAEAQEVQVEAIRVIRYKPQRRCVIEYDVHIDCPEGRLESITLIGKVRASRFGKSGYRLLSAFWEAGFDAASADAISVPEPIATVSKLRMWLQRKVRGELAAGLLAGPRGCELGPQIAEAAHKVHLAGVATERRHTMADELRILRDNLPIASRAQPHWAPRIERVMQASERLGAAHAQPAAICGIHRDFYADQVVVDGSRLYLLDFDLYCEGDPALDIGNFLAHVTEYGLRVLGDPDALAMVERATEQRFAQLSGEAILPRVWTYATLTLVRHIYLSTLIAERRQFTGDLLQLCEARLRVASRVFA